MPRVASTRTEPDDSNLVDGVPEWMLGSLAAFIRRFTTESRGRERVTGEIIKGPSSESIHAIERYLQIRLLEDDKDEWQLQDNLLSYAQEATHGLDVLEAMLATCHSANLNLMMGVANTMLIESGSKWVAVLEDGKGALEERVNATTAEAYESAVASSVNESGQLLKRAWGYAFGRDPSASEAYNYAIKAMEAAAWPVITPNDNSATLGHILGEMRTHPDKWHSKITEKQPNLSTDMLANAMQLVWEGHTDRHGTAGPVAVTQEAAEQAVFTAVMVCAYFNRGYVE